MNSVEAFEKLWAVRGHAEAIVEAIKLDGVSSKQQVVLKETIERMLVLINECVEYRK